MNKVLIAAIIGFSSPAISAPCPDTSYLEAVSIYKAEDMAVALANSKTQDEEELAVLEARGKKNKTRFADYVEAAKSCGKL